MSKRGWLIAAALILAAGISACSAKKAPAPPPPAVVVAPPLQKRIIDWDEYVGRFEAVDSVTVRPRVSGYLQTVNFQDGALVKKGDLLFVIDPRPYEAIYNQAKAQEQRVRATQANAEVELKRTQALVDARAASQQELESRRAAALQAAADALAAKANVDAAALNLGFTRVIAPMAGRISDRRVAPGNLVTQDQTMLTTIVSLNPVRFAFEGPEASFLKYLRTAKGGPASTAGRPVQIRLQDEDQYRWDGKMDFIDNQIDVGSGVIRGRAVVQNPNQFLTPGMFGHMRLQSSEAYQALLVPDDAIASDQDRQLVYVVDAANTVKDRPVSLGPLIDGLRVIRTGLKPGDQVVINGVQRVRPGIKVSPKPGKIAPEAQAPNEAVYVAPPSSSATDAGSAK